MSTISDRQRKVRRLQAAFETNPNRQTKNAYHQASDELVRFAELENLSAMKLWRERAIAKITKKQSE